MSEKANDANSPVLEMPSREVIEVIEAVTHILSANRVEDDLHLDEKIVRTPEFQKLVSHILDLRELADSLNRGDLQRFVYSKGYILANLKALQSNLRHLTWQTQQIADGDFSQRVDFLGDFSESFNIMTKKLEDSSQRLTHLAAYDNLTQIPNRRSLESFLSDAFEACRASGSPLGVMIFDIDHFKRVNDTYGHSAGDQVLIGVSAILTAQFRATDMFARYGGEEFMAIMPGADLDSAYKTALRSIRTVENESFEIGDGDPISITLSAGVSDLRPEDQSCEDIIRRSDEALYIAKNSGRNDVKTK